MIRGGYPLLMVAPFCVFRISDTRKKTPHLVITTEWGFLIFIN